MKEIYGGAIDYKQFGHIMLGADHKALHKAGWNDVWSDWLDRALARHGAGNIPADELLKQLETMKNHPRFKPHLDKGVQAFCSYKEWKKLPKHMRKDFTRILRTAAGHPGAMAQLRKLMPGINRAFKAGAKAAGPALAILQGVAVGAEIGENKHFQTFMEDGIKAALTGNATNLRGHNYREAEHALGLAFSNLETLNGGGGFKTAHDFMSALASGFEHMAEQKRQECCQN